MLLFNTECFTIWNTCLLVDDTHHEFSIGVFYHLVVFVIWYLFDELVVWQLEFYVHFPDFDNRHTLMCQFFFDRIAPRLQINLFFSFFFKKDILAKLCIVTVKFCVKFLERDTHNACESYFPILFDRIASNEVLKFFASGVIRLLIRRSCLNWWDVFETFFFVETLQILWLFFCNQLIFHNSKIRRGWNFYFATGARFFRYRWSPGLFLLDWSFFNFYRLLL